MREKRTPLAIVGIGCRLPGGVSNPDEFWQMLSCGRDGIREVPPKRWDWRRYYSEDRDAPGKVYVRHGGFLEQDIDAFDAEFFGISPREAMSMDPQQRLLLETSWEAIEDAGLTADRLSGSRTGVYVGAFTLDNMLTQMAPGNRDSIGAHTAVSSTMTILSNRLSYAYDLRGPSLSVDTACSSSIVALHLACQGLWNEECDMALVGGVNVIFRPEYMIAMCKGQFLSPDGRSKSFDARADGYGRGEGAGVLIVKPLETALRDEDRVYALIRGTGCNQDGRTNGITVPNPDAQKALILSVAQQSDVPLHAVRYVEAHGTGTPVGDPIEARAIGETFGQGRAPGERLPIGSVKANIGHLEAASGMAGVIKLCMCFKHRAIPPLANLDEPNSAIPFEQLGLRLPTEVEPLPNHGAPVFLAINSFGYGGTNGHVVLESPPAARTTAVAPRAHAVLPISARSQMALRKLVALYRDMLRAGECDWIDVCAAAGLRRSHHDYRASFAAAGHDGLIEQMDAWLASDSPRGHAAIHADAEAVRPVIVFSGMGPQWWGMGQQLLEAEPVFRDVAMRADEAFQAISGWSILDEMRRDKATSRIKSTICAQPANLILQAGLFELLKSWGLHPAAVIGHSVGEMSSAYAAGVLSLEDAMRVSYHRSRLQAQAAGLGGMLAVGMGEAEASALIAPHDGRVAIAAVNAPKGVTLAGESPLLAEIAARLDVKSIFNRRLQVEVAYHSAFMEPLRQPLIDALADLRVRTPSVPLYSTVTGTAVTGAAYDGPYWARNIREPVRFMHALQASIDDGHRLFLEVGPHPTLAGSIRECLAQNKTDGQVISTLVRETDERDAMMRSLDSLYAVGCSLDWQAINGTPSRPVALPRYPWQRETYWGEPESAQQERVGKPAAFFAGHRVDSHEPTWERTINDKYFPYVDEHVVDGLVLVPGAAFVDAALGLQKQMDDGAASLSVEDVTFKRPLVVDRGGDVVLRTVFDADARRVVFHGQSASSGPNWTRHGDARLSARRPGNSAQFDLDAMRQRLGAPHDVPSIYRRLEAIGLQYGPHFRRITELRALGDEVLCRLTLQGVERSPDVKHVLHPLLLDGAFQSLLAALDGADDSAFVPASIGQVTVFGDVPDDLWSYGTITSRQDDGVVGDLWLLDERGRAVATVKAIRCARVARARNSMAALVERRLVQPSWSECPLDRAGERRGTWLLLAEHGFPDSCLASKVAQGLRREKCERVITIGVDLRGNPMVNRSPSDRTSLDFMRSPDDWASLFREYGSESLCGIAYVAADSPTDGSDIAIRRASHLLSLFKQLPAESTNLRAYLITERAQAVVPGDAVEGWAQGSAIGFFRVAHNEFPGARCTMIDHDGQGETAAEVTAELLADDECDDIALRDGARYTQRLQPRTLLELERDHAIRSAEPRSARRVALASTASGVLTSGDSNRDVLHWQHERARDLAHDEIEIELAYCAIAQGDRRAAPGQRLLRPDWREFNGRITRVGTAIETWRVGDYVAAAARCSMGSHVIVRQSEMRAVRLDAAPSAMSASLAMTVASARVALRSMAAAQPGDTVLVIEGAHAGAASFFASAAQTLGLGVLSAEGTADAATSSPDSRQLALHDEGFAQELLDANGGKPVDVVVFCGTVDPALHNRIPLALGGRVVLYGSAAESVDVGRFVDAATMYAVYRLDAKALAAGNLAHYQAELRELGGAVEYPLGSSDRLCTAQALPDLVKEAGFDGDRWIVDLSVLDRIVPSDVGTAPAIDAEGAYLITGGFGGFGLAVTDHLIAAGARHLVLIGRSGATSEQSKLQIRTWREQGVSIREALIDIADRRAVEVLYADVAAARPVKGVFHAAGVLHDINIADMTAEQLVKVMRPKVLGAWNLHRCSLRYDRTLDHFVLFSSASAVIGNGRQANYVAANVALDGLAARRRALGLPGCSIHWGALADVGMATDEALLRHFELMGMAPFAVSEAMHGLDAVLRYRPCHVGIMDVDWVQWGKFEPTGGRSLRFAHLTGSRGGAANDSLVGKLRSLPAAERFAVVELMLAEQIAQTLRLPAERIDVKRPLTEMGIDSLMAVELQIGMNVAFGVDLSALELLRGLCIHELTPVIIERMGLALDAPGDADTPQSSPTANVDDMSEAELDAIIANAR